MSKYTIKAVCRNAPGKDGTQNISIRITINRVLRYFSVSNYKRVTVRPEHWSTEDEVVKKRDPDYKDKNSDIALRKAEFEKMIQRVEYDNKVLSWENFDALFFNEPKNVKHNFTDFILSELQVQKQVEGLEEGTLRNYKKLYTRIQAFSPEVMIEDINADYVLDFKKYLRVNLDMRKNTLSKYLQWLSQYLNRAIPKYIKYNPCREIKKLYENEPTLKKPLDPSEVQKIISVKLHNPGEKAARLRFLFACCTGLAHEDLNDLLWEDIDKNMEFVTYVRRKMKKGIDKETGKKLGKRITIPLIQMAKEVLRNLKSENKNSPSVFSKISNQKYNIHLHVIAEKAGVEKKVTSHVARHTCGTLLLNAGVPEEIVRDILGHSNVKQTREYAIFAPRTIVEAVKKASINFTLKDALPPSPKELTQALIKLKEQQEQLNSEIKMISEALGVQKGNRNLKVV